MVRLTQKDAGRLSFLAITILMAYINYYFYGSLLYAGLQIIIFFFIGLKMRVW